MPKPEAPVTAAPTANPQQLWNDYKQALDDLDTVEQAHQTAIADLSDARAAVKTTRDALKAAVPDLNT